jgi:hypothetical protein
MPKRFSEFATEITPLDGAKMKIDSVINKEILVTGFKVRGSKFKAEGSGHCLTLQFALDAQKYVLFSGSAILIEQVEKYGSEMPFLATIKKIDRYYTLS